MAGEGKIGVVVFILINFLAFIIGKNVIYKGNLEQIDALRQQMEQEEKRNELLIIINQLNKRLQLYQKRSFSKAETAQLLDKTSRLANEAGVKIDAFSPLSVEYHQAYAEVPIKLSLSCEFSKLQQFLTLIESSNEFIWIRNLKMHKSTVTDAAKATLPKIDLTISGLYLKK